MNMKKKMRMKKFFAFCVCAVAALSAITEARAQRTVTTKGGLVVTDETLPVERWEHGMVVQKFSVRNPSARQRGVELSILSGHGGSAQIRGAIEISANATAVAELVRPSGSGYAWQWAMRENGISERQTFSLSRNSSSGDNNTVIPSLLISRSLSASDINKLFATEVSNSLVRGSSRYHHRSSPSGNELNINPARAEIEAEAMPRHWLAYSPYDGVIVDEADYFRMPLESRSALAAYAASGGTVAIAGRAEVPDEWLQWLSTTNSTRNAAGAVSFAAGFGRLIMIDEERIASWNNGFVKELYKEFERTKAPWEKTNLGWRNTLNIRDLLADIPGGNGSNTPVNAFLFLLLLFVLAAGPVATVLLARRNQRIRLFWIVPLFSLVFSGVIFFVVSVSEGFESDIRRQAVTFLDQTNKRAATLGAVGMYTPVAPRGGLVFDNGTEVSPLLFDVPSSLQIECGAKQVYKGFARPRMASFFRMRRVEARAERLIVEEKPDGSVEVVNALGAAIKRLELCDSNGAGHSGKDIAAGARVKLRLSNIIETQYRESAVNSLSKAYSDSDYANKPGWNYANLATKAFIWKRSTTPHEYIAELDGCPFIENPLRSATARESAAALVVGKY